MAKPNRHNSSFDGGSPNLPFFVGDKYHGHDIERDYWNLADKVGQAFLDFSESGSPFIAKGGVVSKGAGDTLNISACVGYHEQDITVPDNFSSIPPTVKTAEAIVRVEMPVQTNLAIAGATLDGATVNYVKLSFNETNGSSRQRAKKIGTYAYELVPSFTITVNSTANTTKEILLGAFTGSPGGSFTFTGVRDSSQFYFENIKAEKISNIIPDFMRQVGNDLSLAGAGTPSITALSSNRIAFFDSINYDLRTYDFDGTDWSQIGNDLSLAGAGNASITALSSNRIAFIDAGNDDLRTYDFDGTDWTQIGNDLSLAGAGFASITALSSNRIAFIDSNNDDLRTYEVVYTVNPLPAPPFL